MVAAVRRGEPQRSVARRYRVRLFTVQFWVERAKGKRLDRVYFSDRKSGPNRPHNHTSMEVEDLVLQLRHQLKEESALGEFGAEAIHAQMVKQALDFVPHVRTINRILEGRGALDRNKRVRHKAPLLVGIFLRWLVAKLKLTALTS